MNAPQVGARKLEGAWGDSENRPRPKRQRPTAAGFTDLPHTRLMVRCDYCQRLCRRTGISGHKQKCGGWRAQYAPSPIVAQGGDK